MTLPVTSITTAKFDPKVNYLHCSCGWSSIYTHTDLDYARSLSNMHDIVETHFQQHMTLERKRIRDLYHGQPDVYKPVREDKPVSRVDILARLRPRNAGIGMNFGNMTNI